VRSARIATVDETPGAQDVEPARPLLRVVKGDPSPEELAALVTVLVARTSAADAEEPAPTVTPWAGRELALRQPLRPGPGAWRASGLAPGTRTRAAL
jgi:hypothetical protein